MKRLLYFTSCIVLAASLCACAPTLSTGILRGGDAGNLTQQVRTYGIPYWLNARQQITTAKINTTGTSLDRLAKLTALDAEAKPGGVNEAIRQAQSAQDLRSIQDDMLWLRWMLLSENADSRYAYAYANDLARLSGANLMFEAVTFFYVGRLGLMIDGARCQDKSSYSSARSNYESTPAMRPILEYMEKMPPIKRAEALMHAISIEEMRGERKPQAWLCNQGLRAMMASMDKIERKETKTSGYVIGSGTVAVIDTSDVVPEYLDDSTWLRQRKNILDETVRSAAGMLNKP